MVGDEVVDVSRDTFSADQVAWVLSLKDLTYLYAAIETAEEVVLDLETTGLDEFATQGGTRNGGVGARVVLASMTLPQPGETGEPTTWVLPLSHPDSPFLGTWVKVLRQVARLIVASERPLTNQNVKFDCRWVKATTGVDMSHRIVWDTRISSHLLDENTSTRLKERAPATFGIQRWDDFDLSVPGAAERVPMFDLGLYAARDTYWTWRLARLAREQMYLDGHGEQPETPDEVERARLGRLAVWCAMPTTATLTAIEQRGIRLDEGWTEVELVEHRKRAEELKIALATLYEGFDPDEASFAPTSHWFRDWTARAVEEGDLVIAELTPTGKPRWNKAVLTRQARKGSGVAQGILDLRSHAKKAEYLASWLDYVTPEGEIHAHYNAGSVVTGRLSSSEPNLQQVTAALKPAFVPREGYVFADLDYSQIELRVAAFISRSVPMIEAFQRGEDLHALLASRITGKAPEDVTPQERQAGKSANFGLLYKMGPYGFREYAEDVYGVTFTMEEAHAIHQAFFDTWEGMREWHARAILRAQQTGQVTSPIGRVRRLPSIFDGNPEVSSFAERAAVNSPVQGFASDLMQIAAASIEGNLPGYRGVDGARIVATVHDSILVEVPESGWEQVAQACMDRMLYGVQPVLARLDCVLDVPLAVEAKIGTRWGLKDVGSLAD